MVEQERKLYILCLRNNFLHFTSSSFLIFYCHWVPQTPTTENVCVGGHSIWNKCAHASTTETNQKTKEFFSSIQSAKQKRNNEMIGRNKKKAIFYCSCSYTSIWSVCLLRRFNWKGKLTSSLWHMRLATFEQVTIEKHYLTLMYTLRIYFFHHFDVTNKRCHRKKLD